MHAQVATASHPQVDACWSPSTVSPIPTATSTAPGRSRGSRFDRSGMRASSVSTMAMTATGTLTQKIARQVQEVSQPPSSGPTAVRAPESPKNSASARPRRSTGNTAMTTASAAGNISAAPMPCTARKPISQAWAKSPAGTAPHSAEEMTKTRVPTSITRRCP
ncbi:hypothetical protein FHX79_116362 [Streptomyces cavourensis]|nr:hypothetical protein FHX79_116362 [Streptomyces cavourensis]GGU72838.1 hypothetical protein GCM10010498_33750 [Streptomyces cavourensis]